MNIIFKSEIEVFYMIVTSSIALGPISPYLQNEYAHSIATCVYFLRIVWRKASCNLYMLYACMSPEFERNSLSHSMVGFMLQRTL